MSCVDCHSHRDMTKFAGPIMEPHFIGGQDEFTEKYGAPGNFYAPNLTPYHLKDWTDGEIFRAITMGVSKDGRALFPAMLGKEGPEAPKGKLFVAQDFAGIKWR